MDAILDLLRWILHTLREPGDLIGTYGYLGLALIIFAECGALVFFLPGDSLLVVCGLYAAKGQLDILLLLAILTPCAIAGTAAGYFIGKTLGPHLFRRPRSRWWRPEHLQRAHGFYERHGGAAIIVARFLPIVRTFVPVAAGMAGMDRRRFTLFNVIGAVAWVASMCLVGYFLGESFPGLGKHIEKVILVVVVVSLLPPVVAWIRSRGVGGGQKT